jgi:hypothetical protein
LKVSKRRQGGGKGPRWGKKVDANQLEIVKALEAIGAEVLEIGWPVDLLVGYRGVNWLLEVKDPEKVPSETKLTPEQVIFFRDWRGQRDQVFTATQAIRVVTGEK